MARPLNLRARLTRAPGSALGAQAGEARAARIVVDEGGFTRFRRATEAFNLVLEARLSGIEVEPSRDWLDRYRCLVRLALRRNDAGVGKLCGDRRRRRAQIRWALVPSSIRTGAVIPASGRWPETR